MTKKEVAKFMASLTDSEHKYGVIIEKIGDGNYVIEMIYSNRNYVLIGKKTIESMISIAQYSGVNPVDYIASSIDDFFEEE